MAQVAERIGQDMLGESYPEVCGAVVQAIRDRALTIVCGPDGCSLTGTTVDPTGMTTQSGPEPLSSPQSAR